MDEEDNTRVEAASDPQLVHLVFLKMENLMDGLKLLNYAKELSHSPDIKRSCFVCHTSYYT